MVEYRLRPEHAEELRAFRAAGHRALQDYVAKLSADLKEKLTPILAFYGISPEVQGYVEERGEDVFVCLPEATVADALRSI